MADGHADEDKPAHTGQAAPQPAPKRLPEDVEVDRFGVVIVHKLDRVARIVG